MERIKFEGTTLPDAINCSPEGEFTQIPNKILRSPEISGKAKALLCLLLSNKKGWHSCLSTIQTMMKEGEVALRSTLTELEDLNYLMRVRYRDKETKQWKGSFWAYTNISGTFYIEENIKALEKDGLEVIFTTKPTSRFPTCGESSPNNTNNKNTIENISVPDKVSDKDSPSNNPSKKERSIEYLPLAEQLSKIIQSVKHIKHHQRQLQTWAYSICQLIEDSGVERRRIRRALNWYEKHISDPYVPVIESGQSLKEKFTKLEAAMQRQQDGPIQSTFQCPHKNWTFGKSFSEKQGCKECEDMDPKLYYRCRLAHEGR